MANRITYKQVVALHKLIAYAHKGINGFYRFDFAELANDFRSGVETPVLMLESPSSLFQRSPNKVSNFKHRDISFLLLDFTGKADAYDKQEEVLDALDEISDDICSYLEHCRKDRNHWLYGLFDVATYKIEKVGPLFDNMYGWNILYTLASHNPLCFEPDKWNFAPEIPEIP